MSNAGTMELDLVARDISGQHKFAVKRFTPNATVGELVKKLVSTMGLDTQDSEGRSHSYRAFLDREARHLNGSELVGDALSPADEIVLQPDISAG